MAPEPAPAGVAQEPLWVALGSIGVAVITTDAQGRIGFMNPAACSTTGWSLAQAVGRPLGEVFLIVDEAGHTGLIRADGSKLPIEHSAAPTRAADGTVAGVVTVFRDVTGQRAQDLAENERAGEREGEREGENEKRFQVMADTAPALIWMSDPGMQLVWFNQGWLVFTGRTQAQEAGGGWIEGVHPDDRAHCLQTHRDASAMRRPFSMDYRLRRHDGDYRWLLDTGSPRWDERGGFAGYIGSCVDITDRKEVEAALARSEALFRRVADANLIGVSFGNTEGRISYLNDEMLRMMGRTRAEFDAGRIDWVASIAPEFAASHESWTTQLLVQGIVSGYQRAFVRPDGSRTSFIGAAALLEPETNLHVNIALDLSPLKHAEEARAALVAQLRDADRRKDEFLATLAHELRNPLAPVANGLAILTRGDADPAAQAQARATVQRQLQHMVRLIDDLLDVSRITRNRLELRVTRVLLSTVLEQAVEACRPSLDAARQPVQIELPDTPVWLQADPVRLVQVFTNLLGNAGKYSPPGSPVFVLVRRHDDGVDVIVRDQGIGIAPAVMPRIFEMFTQGEPGPGQDTGGLGIGLALAQRLVQLHGGDMRARSDGPGRGSEFVVRLPVTEAPAPAVIATDPVPTLAAPATAPATSPAAAATHWRILVVDDNHDATATLALLLQLDGHVVRTAHDGLQALEEAESFRPDAVLLDIGLPGLDGLEVARRLRTQPWGRHAVVLALTGWGQPLNRQASADAGFDAHLVKPVDHELLMRRLGELLRARATPAT